MRNASDVIAAIHGSYAKGSKNGLQNIRILLDAICPELKVPVIHVAGTNGKGSTCAMLESILRSAGYTTGLYTSPFLQKYQERIRINGVPLTDDLLEKYGNPLIDAAERLEQEGIVPTPFELGTALALTVFQGEKVDVAVVEVGMGGRLDPTNIVSPVLCGITAIDLDHMQYLGNTLVEIAGEKAGIIKPGVPVVCHPAEDEVASVFAQTAADKRAPITQLRADMIANAAVGMYASHADYHLQRDWLNVKTALPGAHQLHNTLTVLAMVEQLQKQGFPIPEEAVRNGIATTVWPARMEWCGNILIDGAHNAQGIRALKAYVQQHLQHKKRVLLSGVLTEKLSADMLADLASLAACAVTVTPDTPRAMDAAEYAAKLQTAGMPATPSTNITEALQQARTLAGSDGIIIASGSLYFAGMLRTALGLPA